MHNIHAECLANNGNGVCKGLEHMDLNGPLKSSLAHNHIWPWGKLELLVLS